MKKVLLVLVILVAMLSIAACTPPHTHTVSGELILVKEATCTEDGISHMFCTECGEIVNTVTISKTNKHTEIVIPAVESTCISKGLTEGKKCSDCDKVLISQQEAPLKAHTEEIIPAIESTCTTTGLSEGKKCSDCGNILIAQQETPVVAHTYADKYDETCNKCGFVRDAECAHRESETIKGYEATCTSTGLTDGSTCKKCGEILVAQEVISVKDHAEIIDAALEATCTSTGLTEGKHCSVCATIIIEQELIPAIDHMESDWIVDVEPTKTENGSKYTECITCGKKINEEIMLATGSLGLAYTVNYDNVSCTITGIGSCTDTEVVISDYIDGYKVTALSSNAFQNCIHLTEIVLPLTLETIGTRAFSGCSSLEKIEIHNSVISIGEYAFSDCTLLKDVYYIGNVEDWCKIRFANALSTPLYNESNLYFYGQLVTSIVIPNSITRINDYTFSRFNLITDVTIPDSVTSIGECAFAWCNSLTSVTISNSVTSIESHSFASCHALTNIVIPNSVTSIGQMAFYNCTSLSNVTLPDSVTIIEGWAFRECTSLASITIPNSVTSIGESAFAECQSLESVTLGNSLITIGNGAFSNCTSLDCISIPVTVKSIGSAAFSYCTSLSSVIIGKSVKSIGSVAFYDCTLLTSISFEGTIEDWYTIKKGNDWNDNVPATKVICSDGTVPLN